MQKQFLSIMVIVILFSNLSIVNSDPNQEIIDNDIESKEQLLKEPSMEKTQELLNSAPKAFTENRGQLDNDEVRFYDQSGSVWFTDDGVWFELREIAKARGRGSGYRDQGGIRDLDHDPMGRFREPEPIEFKRLILKQEFVGANEVRPAGRERLGWNSNFFYGNISEKWCIDVPNYGEVYYENLYDGIDLRYYTNEKGDLKYDLIVHPSSDADQIKIRYFGINNLKLIQPDEIMIATDVTTICDSNLFVYQGFSDNKLEVESSFKIFNNFEYGFEIDPKYDHNRPLIIDPKISYSTFLGAQKQDRGIKIGSDQNGNACLTGYTTSLDFPTTPGAYDRTYNSNGTFLDERDIFISKLNHNGSDFVYSTYIGGDLEDWAYDIEIDLNGNAYVVGYTHSDDFPITSNAFDNISNATASGFVLKLDKMGSNLIFSTFLDSSIATVIRGIAVDLTGNAYVTGTTYGMDFPTTPGANDTSFGGLSDGFVTKLNSSGSKLLYSTFIGGTNWDDGSDIAIDDQGNAYVGGYTTSTDFPTTTNAYMTYSNQLFVLKLNSTGSDLIFSTYFGGNKSMNEECTGIAIDEDQNVFITGRTRSDDLPTTPNANDTTFGGVAFNNDDGFVTCFNPTGSGLIYSSYIGGSDNDYCYDIVINPDGEAIIVGYTISQNFHTTNNAFNKTYNGLGDGFIIHFNKNGSDLKFSTYIGAESVESCNGVDIDDNHRLYVTGYTVSVNFSTTPGVVNSTYHGASDVFIMKLIFKENINITSLSILLDDEKVSKIYTNLGQYSIQINVTDTIKFSDLDYVRLILAPNNPNIQLIWNRITNKFTKLFDPDDHIFLEPSSSFRNITSEKWTLYFNLTFNWTYPEEILNKIQVSISNTVVPQIWFNSTNVYQIENDLVFTGNLSVMGEDEGSIDNDSYVRCGEQLTWTGLTPGYEGTNDTYPPEDEYDITIWDSSGNSWSDSPATGENFSIQMNAPSESNNLGETYTINISGIPPECDKTSEIFTIKIDGDNVTFSGEYPDNKTWQTTANVTTRIAIKEINGGSGINTSSVMNCYSIDSGTTWSPWKQITGLNQDIVTYLQVQDVINLPDGRENLVKWRAQDIVGNGPAESNPYRILLDTQNVTFSKPMPLDSDVSAFEKLEVGITISDLTSGVNGSTIEYSTSIDGGNNWKSWDPVNGIKDGNNIDVKLNLTFPNGTENRIKWRASDIAGNGPIESLAYVVQVNTWKQKFLPKVNLTFPNLYTIITDEWVELKWELLDESFKDITYDVILDTKFPPTEVVKESHSSTSIFVSDLVDQTDYYWTVIPKTGTDRGICSSGVWSFTVNKNVSVPKIKLLSPEDGKIMISTNPILAWSVEYNGSGIIQSYNIYLDTDPNPKTLLDKTEETDYYLNDPLEMNTKYYWKVEIVGYGVPIVTSEVWSFTFEIPFGPYFALDLELNKTTVILKPGSNASVRATVTNYGNRNDNIDLDLPFPISAGFDVNLNKPLNFVLSPGAKEEFLINFSATPDAPNQTFNLTLSIKSLLAPDHDQVAEEFVNLMIIIQQKDKAEPPDKPGDGKPSKKEENRFPFIELSIVIVIIVIVILLLFFLMKKRKKGEDKTVRPTEIVTPASTPTIQQPTQPPPQQPLTQQLTQSQPPAPQLVEQPIQQPSAVPTTNTEQPIINTPSDSSNIE